MKIVYLGNELLRQKSLPVQEVNDEIRQTISEMFDLMDAEEGVGLAAPQIGSLLRMFVLMSDDNIRRVFINPQIIKTSTETCEYEEGCLSIPQMYQKITRPSKVTIQALDENGKSFVLEADGFLARIIQHEYDHLDGILYIDRGNPDIKNKIEETFKLREQRRKMKEAAKAAKAAKIQAKIQSKAAKK